MKICTVLLGFIVLSASLLAGCEHTASGFGQDMQSNGQAIQKSVDK